MIKIRAILKVLDAISEWCGKIFSWFIITIIALSLYEVFTRRVLGKPSWSSNGEGCYGMVILI